VALRGWRFAVLAALMLMIGAVAVGGEATKEAAMPKRVVLGNVDHYRVAEPLFEGVRVILNARGETYSPAYVAGISGAAFRIAGPCPCAPTCDAAMWPGDLVKLFGYEVERVEMGGPSDDPKANLAKVMDRVREEIRSGRPVLAWNAFTTAEYDVVCGFDDETGEVIGRGSYEAMRTGEYAHAPQSRIAENYVAPALGIVIVGRKVGSFDARAAELAALKEAVAHAHGIATTLPGMPSGLRCYDAWIASYEKRGTLTRARSRDEKQDLGWVKALPPDDGYPFIIFPSTHRAAADFLAEIAPKYPEATPYLGLASEHFAKEAAALGAARAVLGDRKSEPAEEQCARVAGHLSEARAMYSLGIDEIAAALRRIGGPQSNAGL
jgi:hypothetical protein